MIIENKMTCKEYRLKKQMNRIFITLKMINRRSGKSSSGEKCAKVRPHCTNAFTYKSIHTRVYAYKYIRMLTQTHTNKRKYKPDNSVRSTSSIILLLLCTALREEQYRGISVHLKSDLFYKNVDKCCYLFMLLLVIFTKNITVHGKLCLVS